MHYKSQPLLEFLYHTIVKLLLYGCDSKLKTTYGSLFNLYECVFDVCICVCKFIDLVFFFLHFIFSFFWSCTWRHKNFWQMYFFKIFLYLVVFFLCLFVCLFFFHNTKIENFISIRFKSNFICRHFIWKISIGLIFFLLFCIIANNFFIIYITWKTRHATIVINFLKRNLLNLYFVGLFFLQIMKSLLSHFKLIIKESKYSLNSRKQIKIHYIFKRNGYPLDCEKILFMQR